VHAIAVCDDEEYFYQRVTAIADEMGFVSDTTTEEFVRHHLTVHNGKGLGYAISTPEELAFVASFARETGIVLDPVYSGKALYRFYQVMKERPEQFRDRNVVFWHTGGALGLYDKANEMTTLLQQQGPCLRLDVYGNKEQGTVDISRPSQL
jgi:1-aminocyclopropane-1-carboxylate deaminase/D-cysteine desulfhydrase-like pyridoxal-dependent ACC family enzyme